MNRGASLLIGTTYLCSLGGGSGLEIEVSNLRKQLFLLCPNEDRSTKKLPQSRAPCYVPSFRIHHDAHAELCQEAS